MYQCEECNRRFEMPKKVIETHGQTSPPFEVFYVCPFCNSTSYKKIKIKYCKCCGRRLNNSNDNYCNDNCRITAAKLYRREELRKQAITISPLNKLINEVLKYNKTHGTNYSYGQYVAIIKPKLSEDNNEA